MANIRILLAEDEVLIREGLKALLNTMDDAEVVAEVENRDTFRSILLQQRPDVVVLDYSSPAFRMEDLELVYRLLPDTKVLAITALNERNVFERALRLGVNGHILKCCDKQEITEGVRAVARGDKFFCGKVLDALNDDPEAVANCGPVNLSARELEIIRMVAEGCTNKEVAERLFLSTHTVMTHRKNIMSKLGINNTAGLVMFAVKEEIVSPNKYLFAQTTSS